MDIDYNHLAQSIRENILKMTTKAGSGHIAGPLGIVEVLIYIYYYLKSAEDDFILSPAHMVPALYAILHEKGIIEEKELSTLRKYKSRLQGHTHRDLSLGIPSSGGSLGQGIGMATGIAIGNKLRDNKHRVFTIISDGEINEGSVYEALLTANKYNLDNLTIFVDCNNVQQTGFGRDIMPLPNLSMYFSSFDNFAVHEVNGNDLDELMRLQLDSERVNIVISRTISGKGFPKLENNYKYHSKVLSTLELNDILNNQE